jgi:tetratricopeptide (TPR) repeat protein
MRELRRISDLLGIEPERLGLAASIDITKTPEQIEEVITHVWSLVEEIRLQEARTIIERLVENLHIQITTNNPEHLLSLAHAYHTAGYVVSEATRAHESYEALFYYKQMESAARALNNDSLLNIALTYQGDMHRRLGNVTKAITYLEAARDTTPQANTAARGNGIQLLARAYLKKGELGNFDRAMREAEELAHTFDPATSSTKGHYSPGTVYEEYARSYANLGQMQKALEYLDLAKATLPRTKFWELLLLTAQAMTFIKGNELRVGVDVAVDAANQSRAAGIYRFLERIYVIDQYLEKLEREIGSLRSPLREALDGGRVIDF